VEVYLYFLFNFGCRRGEWSAPRLGRFTPGKDPVPIVQDAGPMWTGAENLPPPPPGFDPQTIQPVASRYTDWAIAAHLDTVNFVKDGHPYEHIPSFVHPHYGDVLFLVLPVVALLQMHDGTIPVATCSEEDLAVCLFTAGSFNQLHWMK